MSIRDISISKKLPAFITAAVLITGAAVGFSGYWKASTALYSSIKHETQLLRDEKAAIVGRYFQSIKDDIFLAANDPVPPTALKEFGAAWADLGYYQKEVLQRLYIKDNPNPTGKKDMLTDAGDDSAYTQVHKKHHAWFQRLQQTKGYYDIFLMDNDGNVVYSVFKELDYATNVEKGEYASSGLGTVFKAASKANKGDLVFDDFKPYAPSSNVPAAFFATPLFDENDRRMGVIAFQAPVDKINQIVEDKAILPYGQAYLVGADGLLRSDAQLTLDDAGKPDNGASDILKREVKNEAFTAAIQGKSGFVETHNFLGERVVSAYAPLDILGTKWALIVDEDYEHAMKPSYDVRNTGILLVLASVALMSLLGVVIVRRMLTNPLNDIQGDMQKLAGGDLDVHVQHTDRHDEIGSMANALEVFKGNAIRTKDLEQAKIADEEMARQERKATMYRMADQFEQRVQGVIQSVASASTELLQTSESMNSIMGDATRKANSVAAASEQTTNNVQTVASAAEEMTASVKEISAQVSKSTQVVAETVAKADRADISAKSLEGAASQIGDVVQLIKDIAEQINLLALNATIESARAGEAGKGFAVVASEVKNLATQTTKATEEIATQIDSIQSISKEVVDALNTIKLSIDNVNQYAGGIASAVEEQSAVTDEIAMNMQTAATGTQTIRENIGEVSAASESAQQSSEQVLEASRMLSREAELLSREVSEFLNEIRNG